jgi:hypothetical protein
MFLYLINLMINKYTSYIIVLQGWNTAARKHSTERENDRHCENVEGHWPEHQKRNNDTAVAHARTHTHISWREKLFQTQNTDANPLMTKKEAGSSERQYFYYYYGGCYEGS